MNRPKTAEGIAALIAISAPGAMIRAGLEDRVAGVDIDAGLARIDTTGLDVAAVREIAAHGEIGFLKGAAEAADASPDNRSPK